MEFISQHWQFLLGFITTVTGGTLGLWRFLVSRNNDLAWRRTAFLFEQARYIETDPELSEVLKLFAGFHPQTSLAEVLSYETSLTEAEQRRLQHALDKFLNVFDRFYYAVHTTKTISLSELNVFDWYLDALQSNEQLRSYCENSGFENVSTLAEEMSALAANTCNDL